MNCGAGGVMRVISLQIRTDCFSNNKKKEHSLLSLVLTESRRDFEGSAAAEQLHWENVWGCDMSFDCLPMFKFCFDKHPVWSQAASIFWCHFSVLEWYGGIYWSTIHMKKLVKMYHDWGCISSKIYWPSQGHSVIYQKKKPQMVIVTEFLHLKCITETAF